jgi:hypothetical protein
MSDSEILKVLSKYNIDAFDTTRIGHPLDRTRAINALTARDAALRAGFAAGMSIASFVLSVITLLVTILFRK